MRSPHSAISVLAPLALLALVAGLIPLQMPEVGAGDEALITPSAKEVRSVFSGLIEHFGSQHLSFHLPLVPALQGRVNIHRITEDGWTECGGSLDGAMGGFAVRHRGDELHGLIELPQTQMAYVIRRSAKNGKPGWVQVPLGEVTCTALAMPLASGDAANALQYASNALPSLESRPGAASTIFIDFDGATVTNPYWNGGRTIVAPDNGFSASTIQRIWAGVADKFAPFNVNVTTLQSRYNSSPVGRRMRCIVSQNRFGNNAAAGVAHLNSWRQAGSAYPADHPCWAFSGGTETEATLTMTIAHEVGHTLGLSHDGFANPRSEYHQGTLGNLSFDTLYPFYRWQPIMGGGGSSTGFTLSQWSKGDYLNANNKQDDLAIIAAVVGYGADEDASGYPDVGGDGSFDVRSILRSAADVDAWIFHTDAGEVSVTAGSDVTFQTVDVKVRLVNDITGVVILDEDTADTLSVETSVTIPRGRYRVELRGAGNGSRYPAYGSLGGVRLVVAHPALADAVPEIVQQPTSQALPLGSALGLKVEALSVSGMTYQWRKNGAAIPGATSKGFNIKTTLLRDTGLYDCIVSNAHGDVNSSAARVDFTYTDSTRPTVAITSPRSGTRFVEGSSSVLVQGTLKDNIGLAGVAEVSLNNGPFAPASVLIAESGLSGSFSLPLTLVPGVNTISARTVDTKGNYSLIAKSTVEYRVTRPLEVRVTGSGTVTRPFPGIDSTKLIGFPYTLTATPARGFVFNGWSASLTTNTGITPATAERTKLTFTHQEGLVLTANFIPNPFTPSVIGRYTGLTLPGGSTTDSHATSGHLSLTLLNTGKFTAKLQLAGVTHSVVGFFDNAGKARFGSAWATSLALTRPNQAPLTLTMQLDSAAISITGTITEYQRSEITATLHFSAHRGVFSSAQRVPNTLVQGPSQRYPLRFAHVPNLPGFLAEDYPQTDGAGSVTVLSSGTVNITAKLADGSTFSASDILWSDLSTPVYALLYSSRGHLRSVLRFAISSPLTATSTRWFRPYQNTPLYPWGWPEGLPLEIGEQTP